MKGGQNTVYFVDPSELYRPEHKKIEEFRKYTVDEEDPIQRRVYQTYLAMHTNQTVDFVQGRQKAWLNFDHERLTIMDALEKLNDLVDESDPDSNIPNIVHAFQTAERARQAHPNHDWFHLTGLIHDLGKIMAFYDEPQWAVVGDTFPVGCRPAPSVVYSNCSFENNPDLKNPLYSTELGMYKNNCGLDKVTMSWGHDEYMYQVLKHHPNCTLPQESLYMIRFHSFYPWHTGGDYQFLTSDFDNQMLFWIREFNKYDLYSKSEVVPDIDKLRPYYQSLIDKYIPGLVSF